VKSAGLKARDLVAWGEAPGSDLKSRLHRVPHLRDGFIVAKVGHRAKRDPSRSRERLQQKPQQIHMSSPKPAKIPITKTNKQRKMSHLHSKK
jgi:hypothetical protein